MQPQIDSDHIWHLFENILHSPDYRWVLDNILTLESPNSFSAGTYTESDKVLRRKSVATTDYLLSGFEHYGLLECLEMY